jgi:hypothetical protein
MNRRNERGMGHDWDKKKREQEQKTKTPIIFDKICVVCGIRFHPSIMSQAQKDFSDKNGAHCKDCWYKKTRKFKRPW